MVATVFSRIRIGVISIVGFLLTQACSSPSNSRSDVESTPVAVERLDLAVGDYAYGASISKYSDALSVLGAAFGAESDSSFIESYARSRAMLVFLPDIRARLPRLDSVESALGVLRDRLVASLPEISFPRHIYGCVIPYNQSVILVDTVAFIGLNHYLGDDYSGYEGFDRYRRRLKIPARIVPDFAEALIAANYPYQGSLDATALSRILYEGALANAVITACPGLTVKNYLGWTDDEMQWAEVNERKAWEKIIADELLFSTNPVDADRLVSPAPSTAVVNPASPGRLGRYIGYRIVRSWIDKHPEASQASLLAPSFYDSGSTLINAAYAP